MIFIFVLVMVFLILCMCYATFSVAVIICKAVFYFALFVIAAAMAQFGFVHENYLMFIPAGGLTYIVMYALNDAVSDN